jgi:uncharacterized RDD family membrane protein YckC
LNRGILRSAAPEGTLSLSVNPAGSVPPWNGDANLRLAAAQLASQAAVGSALHDLEAAFGAGPALPPGTPSGGVPAQVPAQTLGPDLPALSAERLAAGPLPGAHGTDRLGLPEDWFELSAPAASGADMPEAAESAPHAALATPIRADDMILAAQKDFITPSIGSAKLIHADLKVNPWLEQGVNTAAMEPERQSSIDRIVLESLPVQFLTAETAAAAVVARTAPEWPHSDWQGLKLEDQRMREIPLLIVPPAVQLQPALLRVRFKAVVVDGTLTLGAVLAATLVATLKLEDLPGMKAMALDVAAAAVILGALYQILFLTLGKATPGMKVAHLALRTLEGEEPTRAQRCGRLGALFLSLLPAGLGVLWALFDHDHLSLHDRLSRTYLRKYERETRVGVAL